MIIKINPEFGIELALAVPYIYWLHTKGQLDGVITSKGMSPFYYFCENITEEFSERNIDNIAAGLNELPNNWIHHNALAVTGKEYHNLTSSEQEQVNGVLDYNKWTPPPYKEYYKNNEFIFEKPLVFITNKYNLEHGEIPLGYFDIQCLYDMFTYLSEKGYKVIYKRAKLTNPEFTIDQNEINSIHMGYHDIQANVEGIGLINDYQLTEYFENVILFDNLVKESKYSYNETQLRVMANCDKFITVCGGNSILSSMFGGTVISYIHKGKELRPNYFGEQSYFRKLSGANIIPVYDVIGAVNKETYHHPINTTGKNDYTGLLNIIKENF